MVRHESPKSSGGRLPDRSGDEPGGARDGVVNRRTLLQTMSLVGGVGLAGCATIEAFVGGDDGSDESDEQTTTFGYGGTPTPTATSVATTVATTAAGSSTTTATPTRTATETSTPTATRTATETSTPTTTRTTTTTPEDDYGEQGYGQYGYGGTR
ncbi:hypothetical protein [Haloarchaeobius salinus]|uniref:hypothetical protein n=1 Tax=Haloarchaeobius salinus TaxID=1198298 RepID=UPI00210DA14B|nr:hypothetical protein [Haloarchaeobius salinus]